VKNTVGLLVSRRPDLRSPVAKKLKAIVLDEGVDAALADAKNLGLTKRQVLDMCKLWICDDD
jgi:hypothetical protein